MRHFCEFFFCAIHSGISGRIKALLGVKFFSKANFIAQVRPKNSWIGFRDADARVLGINN